jgi:hypothetical protein
MFFYVNAMTSKGMGNSSIAYHLKFGSNYIFIVDCDDNLG